MKRSHECGDCIGILDIYCYGLHKHHGAIKKPLKERYLNADGRVRCPDEWTPTAITRKHTIKPKNKYDIDEE